LNSEGTRFQQLEQILASLRTIRDGFGRDGRIGVRLAHANHVPTSVSNRVTLNLHEAYVAHAPFVANSLRRLGVRAEEVPDALQEVFLVVHSLRDDYDPLRPLRPWLFGIGYRVAARARAKRSPTIPLGEMDFASDVPLADSQLGAQDAQQLVLAALERVELSRRAVFVMADIDDHSAPEIADALQIPLNTVYSRLRLAREEFTAAVRLLARNPRRQHE
jgi:RNA polymerase sigma-70 factor, ECF subfamily